MVLRKPVLSKLHAETHACISYMRIPMRSTRKCGYTHEHLPMSCYRIKLMKFLRFQEVDLQALVNAVASATRSQKADTAPLNQQATCASAPPHRLEICGDPESCRRIIMSTKPTQPLSQDTAVSVIESPPRESLHLLTVFIVRQQDEYFYPSPHNKRDLGLWFVRRFTI